MPIDEKNEKSEKRYPVHEALKTVEDSISLIRSFMEWLSNRRMLVAQYGGDSGDDLVVVDRSREDLLFEFFGINRSLLEREKTAIIAEKNTIIVRLRADNTNLLREHAKLSKQLKRKRARCAR